MSQLMISRLIMIYTVCNSAFDFEMSTPYAIIDMSKFRNEMDYLRNLGKKGLEIYYNILIYGN